MKKLRQNKQLKKMLEKIYFIKVSKTGKLKTKESFKTEQM